MRGLRLTAGLFEAVKADTLSLTAWQVGMYGYMVAFAHFLIFGEIFHAPQDQLFRALVHDADSDDVRVHELLSGELVAHSPRR